MSTEISDQDLQVEMEVRRVINCQNCEKLQNIIAGHLKTIVCLREEIKSLKELHLDLDHGSEFEPQFDLFSSQNPPEEVAKLLNDNVNVKMLAEQKLIQECKTKKLVICIKKLPVIHQNSKFKLIPLSKTSYDGLKLNKPRNVEKSKTIKSPPPTKILTKNQETKPYSFICTICSAAASTRTRTRKGNITNFKSYKGLTSHFSTYHPSSEFPEIAYTCSAPGCGQSFTTIDQIKYHFNIHTEKFKCPECSSCFARIRQLWAHQKSEHTISGVKSNFCCDKCGKILANKWGLTLHLRLVHENHRPHACTSCPKSFSSLCYLKLHEESHMANLSYKCSKCEDTFKTRIALQNHMYRSHHKNEKNNTCCPHCSKVLTDRIGLRIHIKRVHQKLERKFKCDFVGCEWRFPYKGELEMHKTVHLSVQEQTDLKLQKPKFVCELCGLTLRGRIKTHMERHANNSGPFACQIDNCWRRYENEKSLKIHQRNHTNPNPKMNFKSGPKISQVFLNRMLTNDKS